MNAHVEVLAESPEILTGDRRPEPGPVAVPERDDVPSEFLEGLKAAAREAGAEVAPLSEDTRGLVYASFRDIDGLVDILRRFPKIGWVQLRFSGIDKFAPALVEFAERGVVFTTAKGAYAQPVAEHALALTFATLRELPKRARATQWGGMSGESLYKKHVLVVGAGGIALEYLRLVAPFGVTSTVVRRRDLPVASADRTVRPDRLDEVLPEADVVMLAAAATSDTASLINAERLRLMKPSAVLVNIARGSLVDTDALVEALDAGEIFGAGVDVTAPEPLPDGHPLFSHERAIVTPHSADTPEMITPLIQQRIRDNVRALLETGAFVGIADPRLGY